MRSRCGSPHRLAEPRVIRDHHVGEVAHGGILGRLERQLTRLNLELVPTCGLSEEAGCQQRVVEIRRRRRRPRTSGERDRSTEQDSQFPHRGFSLCS